MRTMKPNRGILPRAVCLALVICIPACASALIPCVKAVSSKNGNFLVIVETERGLPGGLPDHLSLNVLPKEGFINSKDRLIAPATYWTDWSRWSVVPDSSQLRNLPECPLPLVTDDGEFVILLQTGPTFAMAQSVLQIYRRRDHIGDPLRDGPDHGVFIGNIPLTDLWPAEKVNENTGSWDDGTPQWFAGRTFEFALDNRELIHRTRWHNTVRIHLEDGFVEK